MTTKAHYGALSILCLSLAGCTIATNVRPAHDVAISKIYVQDSPKIFMSEFIPEVVSQIKQLGYQAEAFSGEKPKDAKHVMTVTANWRWDMAMYLFYFQAMLLEDDRVIGTAEYDARKGGANFSKFGHTAEKIRPILTELLAGTTKTQTNNATPVVIQK